MIRHRFNTIDLKTMSKKSIKSVFVALATLLVLVLITPFLFKSKITEMIKIELSRGLDARLDFGKFNISLLRSFPRVALVVNDFSVVGKGEFDGDTLAHIGRSSIGFNFFSLFKKSGFEISRVKFDNAALHLRVLQNGDANWDIVNEDGKDEKSGFLLKLKRVEINGGFISYIDKKSGIDVFAEGFDLVLRGDLTKSVTTISTRNARIGSLSVSYAGVPMLSKVEAKVNADVEADLENKIYTFNENEALLNSLPVSFEGYVALKETSTEFDLSFAAARSEFKNFISLLPAIYYKDFESVEGGGTLQLNGYIKGSMFEETLPPFGVNLWVKEGWFKYPLMPLSVSNVNLNAEIYNPGKTADETVLNVSQFRMLLGKNPVEGKVMLENLISDPLFDVFIKGKVDLGQVGQFYPLEEGTKLEGIIDGDLKIAGKMSDVNGGRYDRFAAEGYLNGKNIHLSDSRGEFNAQIKSIDAQLSPRFLQVNQFSAVVNQSDLVANGRVDNIIGFALDKQMLAGNLDVNSSFFDLNLLMEGRDAKGSQGSQPISAIRIPPNLNFKFSGKFDKVHYGDLELTDVVGRIAINEGVANLNNLSMKVLGGNLNLSGKYAYHPKGPVVEMNLDMRGLDIQKSFKAFETFRMLAPIAHHSSGKFSATLVLNGMLDQNMFPQPQTLSGSGRFNSQNVSVQGIPAMRKIARLTHLPKLESFIVNDILVLFEIGNGRVTARPFDFRIGQSSVQVGGSIGFDQILDYTVLLYVPRSQIGTQAMGVVNDLQQKAAARGLNIDVGENVRLEAKIGGTFTNPLVNIDLGQVMAAGITQITDQAQQQVTAAITNQVDEVVKAIDARLEARIIAFLEQARHQAQNVRQESRRIAQAIRDEAATKAKRLEDDAPNELQRMLARQAGNILVAKAEDQASRVEREGEANAQRIVDQAEDKAKRIRLGEETLE